MAVASSAGGSACAGGAAAGGAARYVWLALCLGVLARIAMAGHAWISARWPEARSGDRVIAEAIVAGIPAQDVRGWSFDAELVLVRPDPGRRLRARLAWPAASLRPRAGERWQLLVSLRPPRGPVNPAGPDAEMFLFRDRIHALGTVALRSPLNRRIDSGHRPLAALRERIAERLRERVPDRDAAALVAALAVGATDGMTRDQWRVFNATGTTHLVAISGSHVTLFAVAALALARLLWTHALWRVLPLTREPFAALFGLAASTCYALLAGFSVPTQRTLVMLAAWLYARTASRACGPLTPFGIALVAVLLVDPFAPLSAGFWLSFAAMAAIVFVAHPPVIQRSALFTAAAVQIAVFTALAPLTFAWFGSLSLAGLAVNVVAIPAIGWIFVPLVLISLVLIGLSDPLATLLLNLISFLYGQGWPWLEAAANVPYALVHAAPPAAWFVCASIVATVVLMPWPLRLRLAAASCLLPLAIPESTAPIRGGVELTVLDVGEATAAVVRTTRHIVLFELGDSRNAGGGAVDRAIVPLLRGFRASQVDAVVLGEAGGGESPGLGALMAAYDVRTSVFGNSAAADFTGALACAEPLTWRWDDVVLSTFQTGPSRACSLRIVAGGRSLLLPGDVDIASERRLIERGLAPADIVLVARHAGAAASSPEFVAASKAKWAVVSGRQEASRSRGIVLERWKSSGARVLSTADAGAIGLRIGPDGTIDEPVRWRVRRWRPWRAPASGP